MKKFVKIFVVLALITVAVWLLLKIKNLSSFSNLFRQQEITIENSPVIIKQIQALSQLVTVSMYDEIVADTVAADIGKIQLPLMPPMHFYKDENKLVMIGKVTVHIGVDMQQLNAADISGNKDSLHIRLPRAKVLNVILNPSGVEIFIEEGDWSDKAVANLKNKIQYKAIVDAESNGLLAQAQTKAEQILRDFFTAAGYKKVVVDIKGKPFSLE